MDTTFFWLRILLVVLLVGIIYITWAKIPSKQEQREEGEQIIAGRIRGDYDEVRGEFQRYFSGIFRTLIILTLAFFTVNVLMALAIDAFIMSHPNDPVFTTVPDWPFLRLPPSVVSAAIAFMMCSAGWLMIISFFYHNRAVKLALETKYEEFFREN